jgi:hypothetical protein
MVNKKRVFLIGCFLLALFNLQFILAISGAPIDLKFSNNVTSDYDEGVFQINWTANTTSPFNTTANFTIYIFNSTSYNTSAQNNSATGYSFSPSTESNYTFIIQAMNNTGVKTNSTSNISIYVDKTSPLVNWTNSGYNNVTYKKNTDKLTLNISIGDAGSGLTGSYCVFEINGTNETIAVSDGWCNTTQLNLTGLSDGNQTIDIWSNDTVNNVGINFSTYVVWIDTTAPSAPSFTCTPTSVFVSDTITCSCSGADSGSGVNSTSYTANPSTSVSGDFSTGCTITDNAGNTANSTISYSVGRLRDSGGTTSSSTVSIWTNTYVQDDKEFSEKNMINQNMSAKNRVRIKLNEETHYIGITSLTATTATVTVSSTPQQEIMSIGEEWKVEVTGDNYYDILIKLNNIVSNKADMTLIYIYDLIETSSQNAGENGEAVGSDEIPSETTKKQISKAYYYIGCGIILILIAFIVIWFLIFKPKKKSKHKLSKI